MAVPKKKVSSARGGMRRAHNALTAPALSLCPNCQEPRPPHKVCPHCGWYKGREVVTVKE
ncbi:MAG: 50S ribosomal protein L32 [Magnetococcales bacterium]|nr:50S ribosomal protein L32 [Magnetococcales bacterium]MBF0260874.1 50S ribosomal protein L32 [Magnetococcales bacterium]